MTGQFTEQGDKGRIHMKTCPTVTRRSVKKHCAEESLHTVRFTKSNGKRSLTTQRYITEQQEY